MKTDSLRYDLVAGLMLASRIGFHENYGPLESGQTVDVVLTRWQARAPLQAAAASVSAMQ